MLANIFHFLYKHCLKQIFFLFDAETVHNLLTNIGQFLGQYPLTQKLTQTLFSYQSDKLTRKINGIKFPNPVGLSAGFDYNGQLTQILPEVGFGFHTIGTVTYQPYQGNPKPRLGRLPNSQALIVNKGLKSLGAKKVITHLEKLSFKIPTGISIASTNKYFNSTTEQLVDILASFTLFGKSKVQHSYYEMNISCPNTFGGEPFVKPKRLELLLSCLDKLQIKRPIFVKMPIDQSETETLAMLRVIAKHNIQGVIFGNLTKDKSNPDVKSEDVAVWKTRKGHLSGKPNWNRSNNLIKLTKKHFGNKLTIIGCGGIFSGEDAQIKLDLGADLVQLISGMIYEGPQLIGQINHYLDQ